MSRISTEAIWLVIGFLTGAVSGVIACYVALGDPVGLLRRSSASTGTLTDALVATSPTNGTNGKPIRALTSEQRLARFDFPVQQEDALSEFVDRVSRLAVADWIAVGQVAASCQSVAPTPAHVHAQVQHALANNHLLLRAWEIRDAIDSLAIRRRGELRLNVRDVMLLTTAAAAVYDAAIALLLRDYLPAAVVEAQCAPCAALIGRQAPNGLGS
jgi:hypothetical protein